MRHLLNILYVSTQETYLSLENETVLVSRKGVKLGQFPLLNLQGIVCFGNVLCSPFLMGACAERGIAMSFLTSTGRFLARIQGGVCGNILLRKAQFALSSVPDGRAVLAGGFLTAKILNSRTVLQRFLRDHADTLDPDRQTQIRYAVSVMRSQALHIYRKARSGSPYTVDELMGIEGYIANLYFASFGMMVLQNRQDFTFTARTKRPPLDRVNAMLSFLYTLLAHDCAAALESVGLDPAAGFLHADRPGRASLALDLMEEFRACLADRLVLSLINRNQVSGKDFKVLETGAVRMADDARKNVIKAWQDRKQETIIHPFLKEKIKIGLLPFVQALILARYIRGDIQVYPPFIYR